MESSSPIANFVPMLFSNVWPFLILMVALAFISGLLNKQRRRSFSKNSKQNQTLIWFGLSVIAFALFVLFEVIQPTHPILAPVFSMVSTPLLFLIGITVIAAILKTQSSKLLLEKQTSLDSIRKLSWREFEKLIGEYYRRLGYAVQENETVGPDGGVDVTLRKNGELHLVQCKHWKTQKVGVKTVREMYGILNDQNANSVKIVCSGYFTEEAKVFSNGKPIDLIDGEKLAPMIKSVQSASIHDPKLGDLEKNVTAPLPKLKMCSKCNAPLLLRTAKKGKNSGKQFYGCSNFPRCRFILPKN